MTKPALMLLYSTFARIACLQRTACDLRMLQDSVERARSLPASEAWHRKVAPHAQFHCLLADATGAPAFALLARFVSGSMHQVNATRLGEPAMTIPRVRWGVPESVAATLGAGAPDEGFVRFAAAGAAANGRPAG
jgi:hypothetical protein